MRTIKSAELGDLTFEFDVAEGQLKIGERTYDCGHDHVILNGRRVPFWVHRQADALAVWLDGEVYTFQLPDPRRRESSQSGAGAGGGVVKAQMPGKILQVSVKVGERVGAGDNLLLMESMKMELAIEAPLAGTVKKVEVAAEQMVAQGDILVELEEEE